VIVSQVVAGHVRMRSTAAQIGLAAASLNTANETLRLTEQRKEYGVGIVLENIEAQKALTQARSDYVTALAEYHKAQYALSKASGILDAEGRTSMLEGPGGNGPDRQALKAPRPEATH
jgi:outer membrane protein TolC